MGGGLMQLVAYGAQDIYLTGNPQITFFKVVYRRHTNFSMESIEQTFNGSADFGKKVSCTISRNGDLLHRVYLEIDHTNAVKQGFSMITITTPSAGAYTVSHGLTKAPDFIIYRIYDQAMSWYVWHQAYGAANKYMLLNSTTDTGSGTYVFNNTLPTASVITDYSSNSLHHNEGRAMLYYSWHDVPGLQKFGSYVANGVSRWNFCRVRFPSRTSLDQVRIFY